MATAHIEMKVKIRRFCKPLLICLVLANTYLLLPDRIYRYLSAKCFILEPAKCSKIA